MDDTAKPFLIQAQNPARADDHRRTARYDPRRTVKTNAMLDAARAARVAAKAKPTDDASQQTES